MDSMRNVGLGAIRQIFFPQSRSDKPAVKRSYKDSCDTFMGMLKMLDLQYISLSCKPFKPEQNPEVALQLSRKSAANSTYKHTHSDSCRV